MATMTHYFTTQGGYRRLLEVIRNAIADYDKVIATNADAADAGDTSVWHDNFDYEENQRQMHQLAKRVTELKELRSLLTIISLPKFPQKVAIGTTVTVEDGDGATLRYRIAGYEDGDLSLNRLSYTAPLARALLGAKPDETRTLAIAGKSREYTIISIQEVREDEDQ